MRLEMPGAKVNLTRYFSATGRRGLPERRATDRHRRRERSRAHRPRRPPVPDARAGRQRRRARRAAVQEGVRRRHGHAGEPGGYVDKTPLVDLMAVPDPTEGRRRRRLLPVPVQHHRVGPRRRRPHHPGGQRQQLPVLERTGPQPISRSHRPTRAGRQRVHPRLRVHVAAPRSSPATRELTLPRRSAWM